MTITADMIATMKTKVNLPLVTGKSPLDAPKVGLFLTKAAEEGKAVLSLHRGSISPVTSFEFGENNLDFALAFYQMTDKHPELERTK